MYLIIYLIISFIELFHKNEINNLWMYDFLEY